MFKGTYTAIITPFDSSGAIDYARLKDLIECQFEAGITGIVPAGTTGESPTLDYHEHDRLIEECVAAARGRMQVIAGTGANSTAEAVELTRHAKDAGADATLQVTPYYNKPNQEGLYRHFSMIADIGLPVVLYNVPGRTSREIAIETIVRLAGHPSIAAVKEAGGSVDRVSALLSRMADFTVLSGDDGLTFPMMAVGATGVISVASNLIPAEVVAMVNAALAGDWEKARLMHLQYYRVFTDLFIDTNPLPVKAAMAMKGMAGEYFRLPLCPMPDGPRKILRETLKEAGIL